MSNTISSTRPRCLDAAIDYAKRGFSVILLHGIKNGLCTCGKPGCHSPGKHPIGKSWKHAQTERATPEQLEAEFVQHPDANIGIVTGLVSGLVVADLDGEAGMSSLMSVLPGQEPPKVPTVKTGSGFHLYGRHPGAPLKNFVKTYPGLDGRADGGYVVAPPSIHVSGREYKWTRPLVDALPDLPPELLALFSAADGGARGKGSARKRSEPATELFPPTPAQAGRVPRGMKQYAEAALADECGLVAMAAIGAQEITISTAGLKIGRYVGAGLLDFAAARDALVTAALGMVNDPQRTPWMANEVRAKVEAKLRKGMESPKWGKDPRGEADDQSPPIDIFGDAALTGAPEFPLDVLPPVLADFVADRAERLGVDPAMIAMPALAVCAGCIDDRHQVQVRRHDQDFIESARLWVMIVEEPGGKKTPAISAALASVREIECEWIKEDAVKLQEHALLVDVYRERRRKHVRTADAVELAFSEFASGEPRKPSERRLIVSDATTEAMGRILADNPAGLIAGFDELTQLFASFDAYRPGKAAGRDRAIWLQMYNGGPFTIDRVGTGHQNVPNWSSCIIGGIQPDRMRGLAPALSDDGLLQRFIPVFGTGPSRGIDRPVDEQASKKYDELLRTLAKLRTSADMRFTLSPAAHEVRERLMDRVEALLRMPDIPAPLKNHLNKWEALFARLLLTVHIVETAPVVTWFGVQLQQGSEIPGDTAEAVEQLMMDYLLPAAMRFYREFYGPSDDIKHALWIADHILAHRLPVVRERDVYRAYNTLRDQDKRQNIERAMRYLEIAGWIVPLNQERIRRTTQWWVDPRVHELFAERAEQEHLRRRKEFEQIQKAKATPSTGPSGSTTVLVRSVTRACEKTG